MKKILFVFIATFACLFLLPLSASAAVVETENFVYDEQGILRELFVRNINIVGQQKYDEQNVKCLLVIPEKPAYGKVDLQSVADQRLQATGHGPYESVIVIAYSDAKFAVAYPTYFRPHDIKKHLEHAEKMIYHTPNLNKLDMRIAEAYSYLLTNISMTHAYYYDVPDPMREVKKTRATMIQGMFFCAFAIILIWNVIMRWNTLVKIIVFLVAQALIIAMSTMMVRANIDVAIASITLAVLTIANILVVFSEFSGLISIIWPKIAKLFEPKE